MPNEKIKFSCIEIEQPMGKFYIGAIDSSDLVYISFTDRRRILKQERDIEVYLGHPEAALARAGQGTPQVCKER